MNQYSHIQEIKNDLYFDINNDIFEVYEDKILFYPIYNLPIEKDISNIGYILYEKKSWINEVYIHDYMQKERRSDIHFLKTFNNFVCDVDEIPKQIIYEY